MNEAAGYRDVFHIRAPLFSVAIAFLAGTCLGLAVESIGWFFLAAAALLVWWKWKRRPWLLLATGLVAAVSSSNISHPSASTDLRCLAETKEDGTTQWRGAVITFPEAVRGGGQTFLFRVQAWKEEGADWSPADGLVRVRVYPEEATRWGERLILRGGLQPPRWPTNPGQFDARAYWASRSVFYEMKAWEVMERAEAPAWQQVLDTTRLWALRQMALGLEDDPRATGLLAGMLLGNKEEISEELAAAFRRTGTFHIFAVSGQNVGILLGVVVLALQSAGLTRWRWSWLAAPLLIGYCLITGAQASAVRALLMALTVLVAWKLSRPIQALNLWSTALLAILMGNPGMVEDLGFQLSFAVVLSLIVLGPVFFDVLFHPFAIDPWIPPRLVTERRRRVDAAARAFVMLMAASGAAWMGSLPWSVLVFHQISWIALVANLWVVPLAGLIVVVGSLSVGVSLFSTALAAVLNNTNWLVLQLLVGGTLALNQVPGGTTSVGSVESWRPAGTCEIWLFDYSRVPQAIVRSDAGTWVINPGPARDFPYAMETGTRWLGVNTVDAVFVTQLSVLHSGAGPLAQQAWKPDHWILPPGKSRAPYFKPWRAEMEQRGARKEFWSRGVGKDSGDGIALRCLWPLREPSAPRAEDRGLVWQLEAYGHTLLWAGAISDDVERALLSAGGDLRSDVLVQHEHSTAPNLTSAWLRAVRPSHWIHPRRGFTQQRDSRNPLERLPEAERPHDWNQEKCGAVRIRFSPKGLEVKAWRENGENESHVLEN